MSEVEANAGLNISFTNDQASRYETVTVESKQEDEVLYRKVSSKIKNVRGATMQSSTPT